MLAWLCIASTSLGADTDPIPPETAIVKPPSFASSSPDQVEVIPAEIPEPAFDVIPPEDIEPDRHIIISLADQRMFIFENGVNIQTFLVSTGVPGHRTPTGSYSVHSRSPRAYSNKYECYMPHWMAITGDGMYGMHALEGTSYLRLLGSVASHGCIRLAPENATWLYEWVEIGTTVDIVDDYEEPVETKSIMYRVGTGYCH